MTAKILYVGYDGSAQLFSGIFKKKSPVLKEKEKKVRCLQTAPLSPLDSPNLTSVRVTCSEGLSLHPSEIGGLAPYESDYPIITSVSDVNASSPSYSLISPNSTSTSSKALFSILTSQNRFASSGLLK